jgi:hypothetical protein
MVILLWLQIFARDRSVSRLPVIGGKTSVSQALTRNCVLRPDFETLGRAYSGGEL